MLVSDLSLLINLDQCLLTQYQFFLDLNRYVWCFILDHMFFKQLLFSRFKSVFFSYASVR